VKHVNLGDIKREGAPFRLNRKYKKRIRKSARGLKKGPRAKRRSELEVKIQQMITLLGEYADMGQTNDPKYNRHRKDLARYRYELNYINVYHWRKVPNPIEALVLVGLGGVVLLAGQRLSQYAAEHAEAMAYREEHFGPGLKIPCHSMANFFPAQRYMEGEWIDGYIILYPTDRIETTKAVEASWTTFHLRFSKGVSQLNVDNGAGIERSIGFNVGQYFGPSTRLNMMEAKQFLSTQLSQDEFIQTLKAMGLGETETNLVNSFPEQKPFLPLPASEIEAKPLQDLPKSKEGPKEGPKEGMFRPIPETQGYLPLIPRNQRLIYGGPKWRYAMAEQAASKQRQG